MNKKTINTLLFISSFGLIISANIFLFLYIFSKFNHNIYLIISLGCILLSNLFVKIKKNNV